MNVCLVSEDKNLHSLCQNIRTAFPGPPWQLITGHPLGACFVQSDLYMSGFGSHVHLASHVRDTPARHLFLVARNDLTAFQTSIGHAEVNLLLKPVTGVTLAAFLELVVSAHAERTS